MSNKFGTKTEKDKELVLEHQATYEKWWLGETVDSTQVINGVPAKGKVTKVKYIGNSISGSVEITLNNNCIVFVSAFGSGYRPNKDDLYYI